MPFLPTGLTSPGHYRWERLFYACGSSCPYLIEPNAFTGEVKIEKNNTDIPNGSFSTFFTTHITGSDEKILFNFNTSLINPEPPESFSQISQLYTTSLWDVKSDYGFFRPQSMSYNRGKLAYCDWVNHRADFLTEPPEIKETTPIPMATPFSGCWIAEQELQGPLLLNFYPEDSTKQTNGDSMGEITRLYTNPSTNQDAHFSISRQFHLVYTHAGSDVDNQLIGYKVFSRRGELLKDQTFEPRASGSGNVLGLDLISDNYSSVHVFYDVMGTPPDSQLYWNSNKVLKNNLVDASSPFDVFDYPYDVSIIPQGTGTPIPELMEFWVADMHSNRLVKINERHEIVAMTDIEMPLDVYTMSPLEGCDLIAPSAVSACWDGSCWAIDWGRQSVVCAIPQKSGIIWYKHRRRSIVPVTRRLVL